MPTNHSNSTREDYQQRLLRVLMHIQRHLDAPLTLDDLATVACFSPYHFHRVFKGMTGESVKQHIRRLRLERAALHLGHGNRSVTAIAFDAGYESHEAFTRAFRSAFGIPPRRYRDEARRRLRIEAPSTVHYREGGELASFSRVEEDVFRMDVEIREIAPMRVAFIRHTGPYVGVGSAWGRLCGWAGPRGLLGPQTVCLGVSYDDPDVTPADKLRYDACVTVESEPDVEGEIGLQTIGGKRYAVAVHEGPYEELNRSYAALLGGWFPSSDCEPGDGPSLEFYLNDPAHTPPAELRTEICVPIRG